ncbi:SEC13 protein [Pelomyxa schiedti]|nr:SEC13 protein [Pelomyxa schiedti]
MQQTATIDAAHADTIHCVQFDYFGKRMASCSSDKTVKVFEYGSDDTLSLSAELVGHDGPVWGVAWAPPAYGYILSSCSADKKVFIWREVSPGVWEVIHQYSSHTMAVTCVNWAPSHYGLILACGSADGLISILTSADGTNWESTMFVAHITGVTAVSWAPYPSGSVAPNRLASGGCDNLVKIWCSRDNTWALVQVLEEHKDWVRDVAWAPHAGLPFFMLASCSQDGIVAIWTQEGSSASGAWSRQLLPKFTDTVWQVSWTVTGNILAVTTCRNKILLWQVTEDREWKCIGCVPDS